jgi:hypothetical protein
MKFGRGANAKGAEKFFNLNPGVTGLSPPSQKGGDILRNITPGGEYPRNIASFRIFARHICDMVYSNNFMILSFY